MSIAKLMTPRNLLILICVFFLLTRLYKISEIPSSIYWDEASIGYNAYSIAQTGKDEWGESFPIHFRAFGEFKLPVYIYAVVPSVMFFGLEAFSVRFPAVLFSLGVVILTYFLARRIWKSETTGLLSSFFVSASPWFFIFSRTGYEATAGLMFYLLAIFIFLEWNKSNWRILLSAICFILSAYSYNSFRIIVPPTILILLFFCHPERNEGSSGLGRFLTLFGMTKKEIFKLPVLLSVLILFLSIIPIYRLYKYDSGAFRMQAVGTQGLIVITNYLSHFSPDFLIFTGDKNLRSQQSGFGQLYLPELMLLPLGFLYMIRNRSKIRLLPLVFLLIGPIPAAITKESPHALRAISMVPFISIISALGVTQLLGWIKNEKIVYGGLMIICLIFFTNYFINFLTNYSMYSAGEWQYEYKKIYTNYKDEFDQYSRVVISDKYAQPYIFALFYLKYDPQKFRLEVVRNSVDQWGFSTVKKFGKFEFGSFPQLVSFGK